MSAASAWLAQPTTSTPKPCSCRPAFTPLATALGTDLQNLESRLLALAGSPVGLGLLGADESKLDGAIEAMLQRTELAYVPTPPLRQDLAQLLAAAW